MSGVTSEYGKRDFQRSGLAAVGLIGALPFLRQRGKTAKDLGSEAQESLVRYLDPDRKVGE